MGKCVSREQRQKCSARAQLGPSRDPGGDHGSSDPQRLKGNLGHKPTVQLPDSAGERKRTPVFLLSLVRKHSSPRWFICTEVAGTVP